MDIVSNINNLENKIEQEYEISLDLSYLTTINALRIDAIIIPKSKRNQGIGSKIFEELTEFADNHQVMIVLTASTHFGASSIERLKKFYKRFGFLPNNGKHKDFRFRENMYRNPK